ncbi:MAG: phosphoribosyl-ATP diphosphatase [Betaproteobacteria bacterium]|nr:phosphoribosyl-ATP diphosphatase [Betaproteobacteria bacterium]
MEAHADILERLSATLASRKGAEPGSSYVASLYAKGVDAMARKVGEEALETVLAAKDGDRQHLVREAADLWFHSLVLLAHYDLAADDILRELARREGTSGLEEKAARRSGPAS